MKKTILLLLVLNYCSIFAQNLPKLYLNFVSHNEDDYVYNSTTYPNTRDKLLKMAQLCQTKAVKWDMQSDYTLFQAVAAQDVGSVTSNTGGLNVLKYIVQTYPNNVQCEPHSHESKYNYPDLAYMMTTLGLDPGVVMGGLVYDHVIAGIPDWQTYQNPVAGKYYPQYVWAPEIIWGAGTLQHVDDPELYGVWKPNSMSDFFSHNANNHLISYGNGCRIEMHDTTSVATVLAIIKRAISAIQNGSAPSNGFYCTSLFFEEATLFKSNFIDLMLPELMDSINNYVGKGQVQWLFIPEVIEKWKNEYASNAFTLDCDSLSVESSVDSIPTSTIVYCSSSGKDSKTEYINSVTIGSTVNKSGNNNGYGDFTASPISVSSGKTISFKLNVGYSGFSKKEYIAVWIDFNQDGDFNDSGEEIIKPTVSGKFPYSKNITIPSSASNGNTRMRIALKNGTYPTSCEVFSKGEVEDYTLTIASLKTDATSGINNLLIGDTDFTIYPNPTTDNITIAINKGMNNEYTLSVHDLLGKNITTKIFSIETESSTFNLNLQNMKAGSYVVCLYDNEHSLLSKQLLLKK